MTCELDLITTCLTHELALTTDDMTSSVIRPLSDTVPFGGGKGESFPGPCDVWGTAQDLGPWRLVYAVSQAMLELCNYSNIKVSIVTSMYRNCSDPALCRLRMSQCHLSTIM